MLYYGAMIKKKQNHIASYRNHVKFQMSIIIIFTPFLYVDYFNLHFKLSFISLFLVIRDGNYNKFSEAFFIFYFKI